MTIQDFFIVWQDFGLFLYAILKAFLPLPSLEVVLVPLTLYTPDKWLWYSFIGAVGTCIGGVIGYGIANKLGRKAFVRLATPQDIVKGEELMRKYGVLAVLIGGITPIPDFLLAYLAGFTHMNFFKFSLVDGGARLIRSLLVTYCLNKMGTILEFDSIGIWLSILILVFSLFYWWKEKRKIKHK